MQAKSFSKQPSSASEAGSGIQGWASSSAWIHNKEKQRSTTSNWMWAEFWSRDTLDRLGITGGSAWLLCSSAKGTIHEHCWHSKAPSLPSLSVPEQWKPWDSRKILCEFPQFCVGTSINASSHRGSYKALGWRPPVQNSAVVQSSLRNNPVSMMASETVGFTGSILSSLLTLLQPQWCNLVSDR